MEAGKSDLGRESCFHGSGTVRLDTVIVAPASCYLEKGPSERRGDRFTDSAK